MPHKKEKSAASTAPNATEILATQPAANQKPTATANILSMYVQIWMYKLIGFIILISARVAYLYQHTTAEELKENIDCLPKFLYNTFRFDIQSLTYISVPPILATLVVAFRKKKSAMPRLQKFTRRYFSIMLALAALLAVAEFYFYSNFESRYNVVFFDFFDEGPLGLLKTMWEDYPFVSILLFVAGTGIFIHYIGRYIQRMQVKRRSWMGKTSNIITPIIILGISFIFMRGSVTTYTLQVEAFEVSPNANINNSVPNALYLLKKAYKERMNSFKIKSDEAVLAEGGFGTLDEAITIASLSQNNNIDTLAVDRTLFNIVQRSDSTPPPQPNVLFILNESWSNFLLQMDKEEKLDLLCSLRPHLADDILMENIQSVQNGTIYSIESTILAMPYLHYFQSRYRFDSLKTSIAYPFLASGYNTRFVIGADPTWENLNEALKVQYFERIDGRQHIMHAIKGSTTNEVGVYDEFLYQYLLEEMLKASKGGKPQFFMVLTTTNHPPFKYPEGMQLPPLTDEWYHSPNLRGDKKTLKKYGLGAQYANKCLGDFMTALKHSELAQNTIVVAIGDHNVRSILNYRVVPERYKHNVPLYIYMPPKYALSKDEKAKIEKRYGCHYDILPTIARYAFKEGTRYLNIGQDLFDTTKPDSIFFSYNVAKLLSPIEGKEEHFNNIMNARLTLMKMHYQRIFRNSNK